MSSTCFTQSCEQVISGRYQTYDRIIEILQNEEYLEYANTQFVDRRLLLTKVCRIFNCNSIALFKNPDIRPFKIDFYLLIDA